ncbi:NUDIX domain-containing protein [Paenibacillus allorhizosphaerae]|uniref:Nudix hydrolase domain-containing protein n=1 Tax=Paenibacillus allorhizosphaerae TaxID=2849866 RepID=A0ABN7TNB0_9BACL|nr:NUDIX domain-containing protein [Paenibacillus allorhizosphaerae]CAG7643262.1 hypothetical protein PAECIP111802_02981 [Paenibacillus allorhizosphaerae]
MSMLDAKAKYPHLFQPHHWTNRISQFELFDAVPSESLISNVNMVPFQGDDCVVIRLENGQWEIPGGTLEPEEHYVTALRRELIEEAGARLVSPFIAFGAWKYHSTAEKPYKPHLPHPLFYRLVGYGNVEIVSAPTVPDGGEKVSAVEVMTLQEAKARFIETGRPDLAELYELASDLRIRL